MKANMSDKYRTGKMGAFLKLTVGLIRRDPTLLDSPERLVATLKHNMPELNNRSRCPNCEASMLEYVYTLDRWDVILLIAMADEVAKRKQRMDFTEANKVHVQSLDAHYTAKSRTTKASKLGLVAKVKNDKKKHLSGFWLITRRGWRALAGHPVPKHVKVWRGRIEERTEELITVPQILSEPYNPPASSKMTKTDYDGYVRLNEANQAFYEGITHQGKLF